MPASIVTSFQGAASAFERSLANELLPDPGGGPDDVHHPGGSLRELHPSDHDPLDPALGRRRRAPGADAGRSDLGVIGIIGIILLIGIVKKNAIMMIDFALDAERNERLRAAGGDLPGLPAALPPDPDDHDGGAAGRGAADAGHRASGSELRHPLGITIVGGLIVSQVLTLFTTPVIYLAFDRLANRSAHSAAAQAAAEPAT